MSHIDLTLKKLLSGGAPEFQAAIGLPKAITTLPGEIFENTELRVDLLATEKGTARPYYHAEMQSGNDPAMLLRMWRYHSGIANRLVKEKRYSFEEGPMPMIHQVCVYFGHQNLAMPNAFNMGGNAFKYKLLDVRDLRHTTLLDSPHPNDVVLSVVCDGGATAQNIDRVLQKISPLKVSERSEAFVRLVVLASLRGVRDRVLKRRSEMGFAVDLSDVPFLKDAILRERNTGIQTGRATMVVDALMDRFGRDAVPDGLLETLEDLTPEALLRMIGKVPTASSIEGVLGNHMPSPSPSP